MGSYMLLLLLLFSRRWENIEPHGQRVTRSGESCAPRSTFTFCAVLGNLQAVFAAFMQRTPLAKRLE
jgi:hypothetical protein